MKRAARSIPTLSILIIVVLFLASSLANAETLGNITVYVKNRAGENVVENKGLISNLTVELWYEDKVINSTNFSKGDKFVVFKVNHTGSYRVRAVTVLEFAKEECYPVGFPYPPHHCSIFYAPMTAGPAYIDEKGLYTCNHTRNYTEGQVDYSCFDVSYKYLLVSDVLTYVDNGEDDEAYILIPTDKDTLWKYGKLFYENAKRSSINGKLNETLIEFRNMPGIIKSAPWYYAVGRSTFENGVQEGLEEATDPVVERFVSGTVKQVLLKESLSTIVYIGYFEEGDLVNNIFNYETFYKLSGSVATGFVSTKLAAAVGAGAVGRICLCGLFDFL